MKRSVAAQGSNFYINLLRQLRGLIVVMDTKSRFVYSNNYTAGMFGYANEHSMLGIDAFAMKCPAVECASDFIYQDKMVMQTGNDLTILDIHTYADGEPKILLTKKSPYLEEGEILGVICHCIDIHSAALSQTCAALIQSDKKYYARRNNTERSYTVGLHTKTNQLTERELDCVFYLMRGNTRKQIAKYLNISPRTVETHLEQIRSKLNCANKSDVVEVCLSEGLLSYIPNNYFSKNVSAIIHTDDTHH